MIKVVLCLFLNPFTKCWYTNRFIWGHISKMNRQVNNLLGSLLIINLTIIFIFSNYSILFYFKYLEELFIFNMLQAGTCYIIFIFVHNPFTLRTLVGKILSICPEKENQMTPLIIQNLSFSI